MGRPDYLAAPVGLSSRRFALILALAALAAPVAAGAQQTPLQARLAKALRVPHIAPARSGAIAMDLATGEATEPDPDEGKDPAAVALGRKGGLKGGKARAAKMTPEQRTVAAKKAARARWGTGDTK